MSIYLCNGKDGFGNALNLIYNNELTKDLKDIALLDLITMKISKENVNNSLKKLNPNVDLTGYYYATTKNLKQIYLPIFKPDSDVSKKYIYELRNLALSRKYNIDRNHKVGTLDRNSVENLVRKVLFNIYNLDDKKYDELTNKYAIVSNSIQEGIVFKNYDKNRAKSDMEYINKFILHDYRNQITSYTIVRNLVLAYTKIVDNEDIRLNSKEIRNGFTDFEGKNTKIKQLSIFDYIQ